MSGSQIESNMQSQMHNKDQPMNHHTSLQRKSSSSYFKPNTAIVKKMDLKRVQKGLPIQVSNLNKEYMEDLGGDISNNDLLQASRPRPGTESSDMTALLNNTVDILDNNLSSRKRKTHNGTPNQRQCLQTDGSQGLTTLRDYSNYRSRQVKKPQ